MTQNRTLSLRTFELINKHRAERGLKVLNWSETIYDQCVKHSHEMEKLERVLFEGYSQRLSELDLAITNSEFLVAMNKKPSPNEDHTAANFLEIWQNDDESQRSLFHRDFTSAAVSIIGRTNLWATVMFVQESTANIPKEIKQPEMSKIDGFQKTEDTRCFYINSFFNTQLSASPDGKVSVVSSKGNFEKWVVISRETGHYCFLNANEYYLSARFDGSVGLSKTYTQNEKWKLVNGQWGNVWRSFNGKFLRGYPDGRVDLADIPKQWENWKILL